MIILQSFLILCYTCLCFGFSYDVIWDQNYCADQDRYPSSYELPHNSPCSFCLNDIVTLRINSTSNIYENLYRVPSETAMMNCDATTNSNTGVIAFNDKQELTIRSGGSEAALSLPVSSQPYYFISTSNGSQSSAENDLNQPPNTCLQMAFTVIFDESSTCGQYISDCTFNSVFTDPLSSLRCGAMTTQSTTATTPTPSSTPVTTPDTTPANDLRIVITVQEPVNLAAIIALGILIGLIVIATVLVLAIGIPLLVYYGSGKDFPSYTKKKNNQYEMTN